jgi:chaperone required for assembly of F1-ATPase
LQAGYQLMLDAKPVKTPGKNDAVLPTLPLALAVAAEWEWQVLEGVGHAVLRDPCPLHKLPLT